ncbi:MAG: hypothetical protein ACFE9M_08790 [Promethearchaeota archaeon]
MSEEFDFEKYWLNKFYNRLNDLVGEELRKKIMAGSESFTNSTSVDEKCRWSQNAMEKLNSLVDEEKCIDIMTGCACQYPKVELQEIRKKYEETKDIDLVHQMLQEKFESFLKNTLKLNEEYYNFIVTRGWGLAGIKEGNKIIATKIPKSEHIIEYIKESDPKKKRTHYCHCPRIRDALKTPGVKISPIYCYCGAGFYKGIWEEILQKPVKVEVLESVLNKGDVCKIAIHLPHKKL